VRLSVAVIGGVVAGGFLAAQVSSDATMLGVIGGGIAGAVLAMRSGAKPAPDGDGEWYDGKEQDDGGMDWGGDDAGGDGGD